jgi:hypothetical protein
VIGARRDPGIADIGRLLGNGDKSGLFRRGTGCEQRKHDEQDEAGNRRVVLERPGVSVIYRSIELWLAIQHRCKASFFCKNSVLLVPRINRAR